MSSIVTTVTFTHIAILIWGNLGVSKANSGFKDKYTSLNNIFFLSVIGHLKG